MRARFHEVEKGIWGVRVDLEPGQDPDALVGTTIEVTKKKGKVVSQVLGNLITVQGIYASTDTKDAKIAELEAELAHYRNGEAPTRSVAAPQTPNPTQGPPQESTAHGHDCDSCGPQAHEITSRDNCTCTGCGVAWYTGHIRGSVDDCRQEDNPMKLNPRWRMDYEAQAAD